MNRGFISIVDNVDQIVELANEIAAEHTSIVSEALIPIAEKITSSGSLFLGEHSPEVLADYVAGPSHVMPTNGTSKFSSSLSARTFLKSIPVLSIDKEKFLDISNNARILAKLETLDAHESAINIRRNKFNSE
jgi:histidinol dehydrogenase